MSVVDYSGRAFKWNENRDISQLIFEINSKPDLEVLNLSGNVLNDCTAELLAHSLKNKSNLKKLCLNDLFTGRGFDVIKRCLEYIFNACVEANIKLNYLNLSDNALGHRGIELLSILTDSKCLDDLETLIINNNGLGIHGAKSFCFLMNEWLNKLSKGNIQCRISSIEIGRNRLEDEGTEYICSPLKRLSSLEIILIYQNGIKANGITHLVEVLKSNTLVRVLNLNDNLFIESGSEKLAEVFPILVNLKNLDLGDCLIRNKGALVILKSLENHKIRYINIGYNELSGEVGHQALDLVEFMDSCEVLILDGNQFGEQIIYKMKERLSADAFKTIEVSIEDDEGLSDEEKFSNEEDLIMALVKTKIDSQ